MKSDPAACKRLQLSKRANSHTPASSLNLLLLGLPVASVLRLPLVAVVGGGIKQLGDTVLVLGRSSLRAVVVVAVVVAIASVVATTTAAAAATSTTSATSTTTAASTATASTLAVVVLPP